MKHCTSTSIAAIQKGVVDRDNKKYLSQYHTLLCKGNPTLQTCGLRPVKTSMQGGGGGGGGGGQKTKWKTPPPNFEELIESITNMLL